MASDLITYHSMAQQGHNPAPDKSPIQKWIAKLTGARHSGSQVAHHAAHGVRQYSEAGLTGIGLAAIDVKRPDLSDKVQIGMAIAGAAGAMISATEDYATDLRNMGATSFGILTFRKGKELIAKKMNAPALPAKMKGESDMGEDPVIAAARNL